MPSFSLLDSFATGSHPMPGQTANHAATYAAIIIGAGQAGVALSHCLQQRGVAHSPAAATSRCRGRSWAFPHIPSCEHWAYSRLLVTRDSWLGRLLFSKLLKQGEPATPPSPRRLCKRSGVRRVGRVSAASRTEIRCDDGQVVLAPDLSVGWCTGFRASDDFLDVYEFANRYDC